jgi:hypothetical protein
VTGDKRPDVAVLLKTGQLVTLTHPGSPHKTWPRSSRSLWEDPEAPGAAAFSTHWGDNGELHVLVVRQKSIVRYAVGPSGGAPADFSRLTGVPLTSYKGLGGKPLEVIMATPLDYDGDGRMDFVVVTKGGGITLVNRGFGAFLTNSVIHTLFHARGAKRLPFTLTPATAAAPGRRADGEGSPQNLLVLTEDGRLFEMDNAEK